MPHSDILKTLQKKLLKRVYPLEPHLKKSAVSVLCAPSLNDQQTHILFIQRAFDLSRHAGQIAFPGGGMEKEDHNSALITAQRETFEEVGVPPSAYDIIGFSRAVVTLSHYQIQPVWGSLKVPFEKIQLSPNPKEVAGTFWISLQRLKQEENFTTEVLHLPEGDFLAPSFYFGSLKIWGATAQILFDGLTSLSPMALT